MTTASAGANQGATSPGSPAGTTGVTTATSPSAEKPQLSGRSAIAAQIEEMRAPAAEQAEETESDAEQPAAEAEKEAGDAEPQGDKSKDKGKEAEKMIPARALHERLEREKRKLDDLKGQLSARDLELRRGKEALTLAVAEAERLRGLLQVGGAYDEQGETINSMQLANRAREAAERLRLEHESTTAQEVEAAEVAIIRDQLSEEVGAALEAHDLIDQGELIKAMRRPENLERSAKEVAAEIEQQKLERARAKLIPQRPTTASTVRAQRAGGSNAAVRYSNDRKGIEEHIEALRGQRG